MPNSTIKRIVDGDDRSPQEITDLKARGVRVLTRRQLESYLFDDEILKKLAKEKGQEAKVPEILELKKQAIADSVRRNNRPDDIKSASGDIYVGLKSLLGLGKAGNKTETFMRDTLAPLITPTTAVYKELEKAIFGAD